MVKNSLGLNTTAYTILKDSLERTRGAIVKGLMGFHSEADTVGALIVFMILLMYIVYMITRRISIGANRGRMGK